MKKPKTDPTWADPLTEVDFSVGQHEDLSASYERAAGRIHLVSDAEDANRKGIPRRRPTPSRVAQIGERPAR